MKKIWIAVMLIVMIALCGCKEESERMTANNKEMDEKVNQKIEDDKTKAEELGVDISLAGGVAESDVPFIINAVELYADSIINGDAAGYANNFPNAHINAIMSVENCTRDMAVNIAAAKIWEIVNADKGRYENVKEAAKKNGHSVTVKTVKRFSLENTLIEWYKKYDIEVTNIVDVTFNIKAGGETAAGDIRFVRMANGGWEADMSYFDI